ncbi:hypothetical protein QUF61_14550 [Candidatus Venteria ishoeyi]|uniref:DUF6901 family protein n=1 Tax=Candidatus Venteria ishoeyi TaxID=1899563 RepID=UPI0025A5DAC1|nr:hypothetical protein [Candidatus Venteria ishoeyi]MDM8547709.1 hypothetical protein [Candidatus Venteria ishoeyi]
MFNNEIFLEYTFHISDSRQLQYRIAFDRSASQKEKEATNYPAWTELEFQKCSNCPLNREQHPHCPVALDAYEIILGFAEILSFKEMDVMVKTTERTYSKTCDAQTGLRSLIGFVMATSACPVLSPLRGLARYHLPFASLEEILFRVTSAYLVKQYFIHKDGGEADLSLTGLKAEFQEIQKVNYDFLQRITAAGDADSNLDVLSTLFSIASLISLNLDEHLDKLRPLFAEINHQL